MPDKELSKIVGFKVPLHKDHTQKFKRKIVDFSQFVDLYREKYGNTGRIYPDLENRFGKKALDLLSQLT